MVVELESEKTSSVLEREALADWNTCHVDGCIGISNAGKGSCLGHLNEDEQQAVLQTLPYQRPLDLRGVTITEELFARLSAVMEHDDTGRLILHDVDFTLATFLGEARFDEMIFLGRASFMLADFHRIATFLNADFRGEANFEGTHFGHGASFDGASFQRLAQMNAIFSGAANFNDTTFHDMATFYPSTFGNDARLTASVFQREAWFRESICYGTIYFEAVRFNDETDFRGLRAFGDVRFEGALFERARRLGPMLIAGELVFDEATFRERIQITADGPVISCERTRFSEGLNLRAKWARISLDHSDFSGSSILTHSLFALQLEEHAFRPDIDEAWFLPYWQAAGGPPRKDRSQPWIASLCGANVTGVSIANLDLRACIIADAHNLDKLRLEGSRAFSRTPTWKAIRTGWAFPAFWKWTRRHTLAEEHIWRHNNERGIRREGWHPSWMWSDTEPNWVLPSRRPPAVLRMLHRSSGRQSGRLSHLALVCTRYRRLHKVLAEREMRKAQEIAGIYRALRKGHEDNKNEPGAADFYYGEMEMRRAALPRGVERAVLKLYWLMSGYGLRASRSIVATLATLMGASLLFLWIGFAEDHPNSASTSSATRASTSLLGALIYSARIGIGLLRDPQPRLTLWGDFTQIVVRIAVPLFLGLAVLAIRGRVKR